MSAAGEERETSSADDVSGELRDLRDDVATLEEQLEDEREKVRELEAQVTELEGVIRRAGDLAYDLKAELNP